MAIASMSSRRGVVERGGGTGGFEYDCRRHVCVCAVVEPNAAHFRCATSSNSILGVLFFCFHFFFLPIWREL